MDRVVFLEGAGVRLAVCSAAGVAREASARHGLKAGSAAALAQGLVGSLLVAATEKARVDVQLECGGPLRGLLADADESGAVRGLVRVNDLDVALAARPSRFDARPILATPHDEKAGLISILRAREGEQSAHRAAFPFAGADLGAALTFFLRNDRALGGELALEVLVSAEEPLAAAAGALLWGASEDDEQRVRPLGKPLRQGALHRALVRSADAHRLARELARELGMGDVTATAELEPRFACRCSRERVIRALRTLGAAELRDMAEKDGGASLSCDFCAAKYQVTAQDLLRLAAGS
jgi:molecular chaperone Hsp33